MLSQLKAPNPMQDQSGVSLVSVLVAVGIAGIMALGLASVFKNSFDAQNRVTQQASSSNISQIVQTLLNNEKSCTASFINSKFDPENNKRQDIKLYNSGGHIVIQPSGPKSSASVAFKGIKIHSIQALAVKADDQSYQVTIEIKTDRVGTGNLAKINTREEETYMVNIATDDKGKIASCNSGDEPYKIVNIENGLIKIPGNKSSYSMHNYMLNAPYNNGGTWESKMEHRACVNETTGGPTSVACTEKVLDQIIDFKAKGNMIDVSLSALLTATGPGQTAQLEAYLLQGNTCIKKTIVHAVQTGGGVREMQTSNGGARMIVDGLLPGKPYRLRFKFIAPRYRNLAAMIHPSGSRLHDPSCGGIYAGHINVGGNPNTNSFYCPIFVTYWGGNYSLVEYKKTGKAGDTKVSCKFP